MFLMLAEVLKFCQAAKAWPSSSVLAFLCHHQSHVEWVGCSLHDLIQPGFSFLVGVAMPFSIASRMARGQTLRDMTGHALWRVFILVALGIALRSIGQPQTNFTFTDTLAQIGLGYFPLFLIAFVGMRARWVTFTLILVGYWMAFALYPLPGAGFDWSQTGIQPDWSHHATGFAAHWNKNTNLAWAFDRWFLNIFPQVKPFEFSSGGYATLSFIPTLATMILGQVAGTWMRQGFTHRDLLLRLVAAGLAGLCLGALLDFIGLCPNVKRIWTPAWVLFSGGWCFLILATLYAIMDLRGWKAWAFPLMVVGANSIFAYVASYLFKDFIRSTLLTHFGKSFWNAFGEGFQPVFLGTAILLTLWLILFWLYKKRIFLKI